MKADTRLSLNDLDGLKRPQAVNRLYLRNAVSASRGVSELNVAVIYGNGGKSAGGLEHGGGKGRRVRQGDVLAVSHGEDVSRVEFADVVRPS